MTTLLSPGWVVLAPPCQYLAVSAMAPQALPVNSHNLLTSSISPSQGWGGEGLLLLVMVAAVSGERG